MKNIILFTDSSLDIKILKFLGVNLKLIVGASLRPKSHKFLENISKRNGIKFLVQPKSSHKNYKNFVLEIKNTKPDLYFIYSYSMIINRELLSIPKKGGINIHYSLLPINRGCSPLQWGIINEDKIAGVTIHEIDEGIDTGKIIDQISTPILFSDTWLTLTNRLNKLSIELIKNNIKDILNLNWKSKPQDSFISNYNPRRYPEDGIFQWTEPTRKIYNLIRALVEPLPGAFYLKKDKKIVFKRYLNIQELTILKFQNNINSFYLGESFILKPISSSLKSKNQIEFEIVQKTNKVGEFKIIKIDWKLNVCDYSLIFIDGTPNDLNIFLKTFILKEYKLKLR